MWQFFHQAFGAQFRKVVAQGGQRVLGLGQAESVQSGRIEIGGGEGGAGGDVSVLAQREMEKRRSPLV